MMFGRKKTEKEPVRTLKCKHVVGLPLAEGAHCALTFDKEGVEISSGGNNFRLAVEKITDVTITTSTAIQKSYVSSVGGAVAGAALFGPLGALVGGRVKEMADEVIDEYFIITYTKDGVINYLSFLVPDEEGLKVIKIIEYFRPLLSERKVTIDL